MKHIMILTVLFILGCASSPVNPPEPTPFVVGKTKVNVVGCTQLHKEVNEWNKANPDKEPRIADC